jgi:hypothetical protein
MRLTRTLLAAVLLTALALLLSAAARPGRARAASTQDAAAPKQEDPNRYVYADFEEAKENRPVSSHGGLVQLVSYQENSSNPARYKGLADANPAAPELVRLKKDDPNHAAAFDYELTSPNQYAGVGVEIHGRPDKDGKTVADDMSAYKDVTLQIYATGVQSLRLEIMSRGQGSGAPQAFPQATFKVTQGFNTYKIPLKSLLQPEWAQPRLSSKDVLKKLTAVGVTAYCNACVPAHGTVIVDNVVFEK